jgi:hypothetical protein
MCQREHNHKNSYRVVVVVADIAIAAKLIRVHLLHNNEAMNIEANDAASENWEKLFSQIQECTNRPGWGDMTVTLPDTDADVYDFANATLMRRMRERLVEVLQRTAPNASYAYLMFGNKFFMTMNEEQQRSFFHRIFRLPVWGGYCSISVGEATDNGTVSLAITISNAALLDTLPELHTSVRFLNVSNFALASQSDVRAVSTIILSKCETLETLELKNVECPVDDSNKEDSDETNGFLDPLFYAATGLEAFSVSTKARSVHSSLVSPRALRALFVEGKRFHRLTLSDLGLTDSHVLAIVDGLSTPGTHLSMLNLESNPGITARGYGALFNLINRTNAIGYVPTDDEWIGFCVDDKAWEGKLNLVSRMNTQFHRLEYLTNGSFSSEERRWQWLERLAQLTSCNEDDETKALYHANKKKMIDAKHLTFIWYTLCQNPEMMQI